MPSAPRALLPDLSPWRSSRDFRYLWYSGLASVFGSFLTFVALPLQLKELTGSAAAVGALGLVQLLPLLVFGLYGGALADAFDRRRLIVLSEAAMAVVALGLLANALLPSPRVWPLYAAAALTNALTGIQRPALDALIPRLVPHGQLTAAVALSSLRWQLGGIAGPALAGVVIATTGVGAAYGLHALTFTASLLLALRLRPAPPAREAARPSLRGVVEGARYAWGRKELLGTYAVDTVATLMAFPIALFPFLAERLDAQWALGLLYSTLPLGSLLVSLASGWTGRIHRHGRAVVLCALGFGAAVMAAGLVESVWLVLVLLTVAGGFDMVSGIFRATMWHQTIPDELRGRLAGIELLSYTAGPQLGQVRAGGMAALTSVRTSLWAGGALCVLGLGLLTLTLPKLWSYDARTDEHARAQREARAADGEPAEPRTPAPRRPDQPSAPHEPS